jgi:hypothetical protein
MNVQCVLASAVMLMGCIAATAVASERGAPATLPKGAACIAAEATAAEGATHHCWFIPRPFGKRDFSTRNGRAQYVFSELERCDEIEILSDAEHPRADGEAWRVVALRCID